MLKNKKLMTLMPLLLVILAGCGNAQTGEKGIWDYIVNFFSDSILYLAHAFNNNYALGIILFTILTRIVLLPVMQYQTITMRKTSELQPEMKKLREQYAARDRETQLALQDAIKELNAKHGVNQWAGCLPALAQMPIMIALYQAVANTQELQNGHFFWASLGKQDPYFILPIVAAFFTWLNSYLTMQGQTKDMQQMKFMQLYFLPGMILFFSLSVNAGLALYWVVGGLFSVFQTLILNNPFQLRAEREEKIRTEKAKARAIKKAMKKAYKK